MHADTRMAVRSELVFTLHPAELSTYKSIWHCCSILLSYETTSLPAMPLTRSMKRNTVQGVEDFLLVKGIGQPSLKQEPGRGVCTVDRVCTDDRS